MRRLLILLFLVAALLSACGDDGDKDNVASRSTTTEADDAATDEGEEDGKDGEGETDVENFSGKGSDDFCEKAREYEQKFAGIGQNSKDAAKEWGELEEAIEDIASDAPAEIKDDVNLVLKNFKDVKALYEKYDYDFSKVTQEEMAAIDSEGVEEANGRLNAYMESVCKIDQDGDGDTDGKDSSDTSGDTTTETDPPADE